MVSKGYSGMFYVCPWHYVIHSMYANYKQFNWIQTLKHLSTCILNREVGGHPLSLPIKRVVYEVKPTECDLDFKHGMIWKSSPLKFGPAK